MGCNAQLGRRGLRLGFQHCTKTEKKSREFKLNSPQALLATRRVVRNRNAIGKEGLPAPFPIKQERMPVP
jgi:hypothetical protein